MDSTARHRIAIRLIQDAHPDTVDETYVLARMIRTGGSVAAILVSTTLALLIDRHQGLREELEALEEQGDAG
jgi:hypothetical protein